MPKLKKNLKYPVIREMDMKSSLSPKPSANGEILFKYLDKIRVVRNFLDAGEDPNYTVQENCFWKGWTPLAYAVYSAQPRLVHLLLLKGADVNQNYPGESYTLFEYSIKQINDSINFSPTPLGIIPGETRDYIYIAIYFFYRGAKIPTSVSPYEIYNALMLYTIITNKIDHHLINKLMAIPSISKPLFYECLQKNVGKYRHSHWKLACEIFTNMPMLPDVLPGSSLSAVEMTLKNCDWEMAYELINRKSPIPEYLLDSKKGFLGGCTVKKYSPIAWMLTHTSPADYLQLSSSYHQNPTNCLQTLLIHGHDPNKHFEHAGNTWAPLGWAVYTNNRVVTRILLKHGANPHETLIKGTSFLIHAAFHGYYNICEDLIIIGKANLEHVDNKGRTALDEAIRNHQLPTIALLLTHQAIIKSPVLLYLFLNNCDQCDPDVLISLSELYRQETNLKELKIAQENSLGLHDEWYAELKNYLPKLTKLTLDNKKNVLEAIDIATTKRFPSAILQTIGYFDAPLQRQHIGFFKPRKIDILLSEVVNHRTLHLMR